MNMRSFKKISPFSAAYWAFDSECRCSLFETGSILLILSILQNAPLLGPKTGRKNMPYSFAFAVSLYSWVLITETFLYLQLFDAAGRYILIEMCLQSLYICHELHLLLLEVDHPVLRHLSLSLLLYHLGLLKEHLPMLFLLQRWSHSSWQPPDPHLTCGFLTTHSLISDERVCHIYKHRENQFKTRMFVTSFH